MPDITNFPGLNIAGYTTTTAVKTSGPVLYEGVLIEWTDSNISDATFEDTARELMRIRLGDLIFNPAAKPGDAEWRILYVSSEDGGSGEANTSIRSDPQRLDNLVGKILRIIPDLNEHTETSTVSENGRYRIPNDNPFVSRPGARKEIWAYGLWNPHRLSWAVDPADAANNRLIANSVGLHTWETVNIIYKGANYGYSLREGNELLQKDNKTAKLPARPTGFRFRSVTSRTKPSCPHIPSLNTDTCREAVMLSAPVSFITARRFRPAREISVQRYHDGTHLVLRL
jgi:hypothetical protein